MVIGEPQRAFYRTQFSLTFPLFQHCGIELWVASIAPEERVGAEIPPSLDAIAREGARRMLVAALESEVAAYLEEARASVTSGATPWSPATATPGSGR